MIIYNCLNWLMTNGTLCLAIVLFTFLLGLISKLIRG